MAKKQSASPQEPEKEEAPDEASADAAAGDGQDDGSLPSNVASAICYLLGHVTGIVFLLVEKEDEVVRFHAMQSVVASLGVWFLLSATHWVPVVGPLLYNLANPIAVALIAGLAYVAYTGKSWRLPFFGPLAVRALAEWDECMRKDSP